MSSHADSCQTTLRVGGPRIDQNSDEVVLQGVAAKLGWCLSWDEREANTTRRLAMVRDGGIDVVYDAFRNDERLRYSWFSDPYRDEAVQLYVRQEDLDRYRSIHSFDDLLASKAVLVTLRNAWMGQDYAAHRDGMLKSQHAYEVDRFVQGQGMLRMHHADFFMAPDTFSDFLHREGETQIVPLEWLPYRAPVHYMFSRKTVSAEQVGQFNRALAQVLQTQKYQSKNQIDLPGPH